MAFVLPACLYPVGVEAIELYRYINDEGITVLDSYIPAQYVKNGYTVMNQNGRVLEVVPRALSDDEIRQRDSALAVQKRSEKQGREQEIADQNLMRIYSTPEDVVRARDTKIASVEGFILTSRQKLARLESQKRMMESQFADIERSGRSITKDRLGQVSAIGNRIHQKKHEIVAKQEEIGELQVKFESDLKRVKELYGEAH